MPTQMPRRVRKTYTRDRSRFPNRAPVVKMVVYIRYDQAVWLAEEEERRLVRKGSRKAAPPLRASTVLDHPDDAAAAAPPVIESKGRNGKYSEMTREGIDLLIEYSRHAEFMAGKLRGQPAIPAAPGREPAAKSPESAAPGPQSSGNSGRS